MGKVPIPFQPFLSFLLILLFLLLIYLITLNCVVVSLALCTVSLAQSFRWIHHHGGIHPDLGERETQTYENRCCIASKVFLRWLGREKCRNVMGGLHIFFFFFN